MKKILILSASILYILFSSKISFSQDEQKIKDGIVEVYENIFSTGDFTDADKYIDAGIVDHTPDQGQTSGLDGVKGAFKVFRNAFPDLKFKIIDIIVNGNKAAVFCNITGTNKGELMGMPPTNKKVDYNQLDLLYFNKNSKAIDRWGYFDLNALMQQLGMMK